jgi:hypothetical protein
VTQAGLPFVQRWRSRRDSYRPAGEVIRPERYEVAELPGDREARAFVEAHHYSASYPAARLRFGLYERGELAGVAVLSVPMSAGVLAPFGTAAGASVELGRFVLLDHVPGNGETWFLARVFRELRRRGVAGVVAFSDPVPRFTVEGRCFFPGHVGTIYQAHNARFLGRGDARTIRLLPDGRVLSARSLAKLRTGDRGWRYAAALLEVAGAPSCPTTDAARRAWVRRWVPELTRPMRHRGTLKYAWPLAPTVARELPEGGPYPKRSAA